MGEVIMSKAGLRISNNDIKQTVLENRIKLLTNVR